MRKSNNRIQQEDIHIIRSVSNVGSAMGYEVQVHISFAYSLGTKPIDYFLVPSMH